MQFETGAAVERAMDLFWAQGYAGTTPQQLASGMGIGKGSLYNTFESKHALFLRALERYTELRLDYLTDLFAGSGPVAPCLKQAAVELSGLGEHQRGCVMVNATAELGTTDPEVDRIADRLFSGIASRFEDVIRRGRETGELTGGEAPEVAGRQLLALVVGLSVLVKSGAGAAGTSIVDGFVDAL
ncbi:TetR/AcrR family transcriptional regulator [Nocardioides sp. AN3]